MADKNELVIRLASPLDAVNILRLLMQGWADVPATRYSRVNEQKALEYVLSILRSNFVTVAEMHGRLVGTIALVPTQEPWSDDTFMADEWLYVTPAYVSRGVEQLLIEDAEKYIEEKKMPFIIGINMISSRRINEVFRTRPGYQFVGGNYLRPLLSVVSNGGEHVPALAEEMAR